MSNKEPILKAALRTFLRMFFAILGLFFSFFLVSVVYGILNGSNPMIEEKTAMEVRPDAQGKKEFLPPSTPVVLELKIHGPIGMMDTPESVTSEHIENILIDSRTKLLAKDRVKAILLHFNTPGGSVFDSDDIYRMLLDYKARYQVPIFAYVDGLCASGGMYIASAADQIFASPSSVIGSVGVVSGPFFNFHETLKKIGVDALTLTEGKDKDSLNPMRPWKPDEAKTHQDLLAGFYDRFVEIVTNARPKLERYELTHEYGAKVFIAKQAEERGYIDVAGASRADALNALLKKASLNPEEPYQVVELKNTPHWISHLVKGIDTLAKGKVEHRVFFGEPTLKDPFAYLYLP